MVNIQIIDEETIEIYDIKSYHLITEKTMSPKLVIKFLDGSELPIKLDINIYDKRPWTKNIVLSVLNEERLLHIRLKKIKKIING